MFLFNRKSDYELIFTLYDINNRKTELMCNQNEDKYYK